jgi:hypothetical protein
MMLKWVMGSTQMFLNRKNFFELLKEIRFFGKIGFLVIKKAPKHAQALGLFCLSCRVQDW